MARNKKRARTDRDGAAADSGGDMFNFDEGEDHFSDLILAVEHDGAKHELHVQRGILALSSPVFRAMFTNGMKESTATSLELEGKHLPTLKGFLRQIYPAKRPKLDFDMVHGILMLADEYQVRELKDRCKVFLDSHLSRLGRGPDDATALIKIAVLATHFSWSQLEQKCKEAMEANYAEVVRNADFYKLLSPQLVQDVVQHIASKRSSLEARVNGGAIGSNVADCCYNHLRSDCPHCGEDTGIDSDARRWLRHKFELEGESSSDSDDSDDE